MGIPKGFVKPLWACPAGLRQFQISDQASAWSEIWNNDKWYANYTSLPTPRAYAQAAALGGKIYVMGGIASNLNTLTNAVEEYSPDTNTWKTMTSMPLAIAGGVTGVVGQSIYIISGSIAGGPTVSVSAPPVNTIYQFTPSTNSWTAISTTSSIFPRADMAGCALNGTIFYTGGRTYAGVTQNTSSAYVPSSNSIVSGTVSSFSVSRFFKKNTEIQ